MSRTQRRAVQFGNWSQRRWFYQVDVAVSKEVGLRQFYHDLQYELVHDGASDNRGYEVAACFFCFAH